MKFLIKWQSGTKSGQFDVEAADGRYAYVVASPRLALICKENGVTYLNVAIEQIPTINKQVEALQDGECPCCHGSWGNPNEKTCKGCGYELDEE